MSSIAPPAGHPLQQRLRQILEMIESGRPADAAAAARGLVRDMPGWADAQCVLGIACARMDDGGAAHDAFQAALAADPAHLMTLMNFSAFLRERDFAHQAMALALRATQVAPADARTWLELGWCARGAHRRAGAIHAFSEADRLQPGNTNTLHALSHAQADAQRFDDAEATLERVMQLHPEQPALLAERAMRRRQQGQSAEALALLDLNAQQHRDHAALLDVRSGVLADLDHTDHALAEARAMVNLHPQFLGGLTTLAHLEWEYGQGIDAANAVFDRACEAAPADVDRAFARIHFLQSSRQHAAALQRLSEVESLGVPAEGIAWLRAFSVDESGDHDEAHRLFTVSDAQHGRNVAFLNLWTRNRLRARDAKAAENLAQRSIGLDGEDQEALAYLATAWRLMDDPREFLLCDYDRLIALVNVPPPTGEPAFFDHLKDALTTLHQARHEPVHQSVRGGSQTTGRLFATHRPDAVRRLQPMLTSAVDGWLAGLPVDAQHPFLRRNSGHVRITGSWSVRLRRSGNHVNHIHNEGWISSALYVSLPPSVATDTAMNGQHAGWIQFGQPPVELGLDLPPRRLIHPQVGKLALFPSYMWHGTVPFEDDAPRITVAFDMIPKD